MNGLRIEFKGGKEALARLDAIPAKAKMAVVMALNDTGESLRAEVLREIGTEVNIKRVLLRERIRLTRATRGRMSVRIWAMKKGLVLSHFPHKQLWKTGKNGKRRPAGVQISVSGRTSVMGGAFIVKSAGSGRTDGLIFVRYGPKREMSERRGAGPNGYDLLRQRIRALYGPSPSQILNTRKPDFEQQGESILQREVRRQLERAKL